MFNILLLEFSSLRSSESVTRAVSTHNYNIFMLSNGRRLLLKDKSLQNIVGLFETSGWCYRFSLMSNAFEG